MGDKDFFLSPDDAQTMGNIDYMRTTRRTRRTFPKTLKNKDGFAVENIVSSIEDRNNLYQGNSSNSQNTTVNTVFNPTPSSQSQPGVTGGSAVTQTNSAQSGFSGIKNFDSIKTPEERRKPDKSMDMFRSMAKGMRGKK
jgi:hypothetical protein